MGLRLAADATARESSYESSEADRFRDALLDGLSRPQKAVSPKWFYDAEGSRLFEDITRLPEYYPTRQETALLRRIAPDLTAAFGAGATLVEFGSGASEKTRIILDAAPHLAAYVPIDISIDALREASQRIAADYPDLKVLPMAGDFLHLGDLPEGIGAGRRIGFFPGSTIGNLEPAEAVAFLAGARRMLGADAQFILGVDLVKEPGTLIAAYDDATGVTAAFNKNLLVRANAELGADFDLDAFDHRAVWNEADSRVEMHLVANRDQRVSVAGRSIPFGRGESIHTESSRKFTEASLREMAAAAGWTLTAVAVGETPAVAVATLAS